MKDLILASAHVESNVKNYVPSFSSLEKLACHFDVFSDPTRLKIISSLAISPLCVGDMSSLLSLNQTTISHQLKILRNQKIVEAFRNGKLVVYSLSSKTISETLLLGVNFLEEYAF